MRLLRTSASLAAARRRSSRVVSLFWPANLGGRTTFVSTHGTSMIPRFHAGDLAIVQPARDYRVGEIAAYHSTTLHDASCSTASSRSTTGGSRSRATTTTSSIPTTPRRSCSSAGCVARIPHGGAYRGELAKPIVLFPVLAVVFGGFVFGAKRSRPRGGREHEHPGTNGAAHRVTFRPAHAVPANDERQCSSWARSPRAGRSSWPSIVWHVPRTQARVVTQPYRQTATIGYSGAAPRGAVYPDGHLHTGDPMFTKMIHRATVDLHFAFASNGIAHSVRGTSEVVADVSSTTGWHRELVARVTPCVRRRPRRHHRDDSTSGHCSASRMPSRPKPA